MNKKIIYLILLLFPLLLNSCLLSPSIKGNGNVVEEERRVSDFDEIKVSRGMNVHITYGNETKVLVKADENLVDAIVTSVEGDKLVITTQQNIRRATSKEVYVTVPGLESIKTSSGSNVYSENTLIVNDFDISASSGSNIKLTIEADGINAGASSGSNIRLEGKAESINASASSGANIKAEDLRTRNSELKVSSGANIWCNTSNHLQGKASSGGNIFYRGEPSQTDISKSSGGNVIKM